MKLTLLAEALVISRNTVERHVNHIFAKIGASNRVEAAMYAQRQGLSETRGPGGWSDRQQARCRPLTEHC